MITTIFYFLIATMAPAPYWHCTQIGTIGDNPSVVISELVEESWNIPQIAREKMFALQVKKHYNLHNGYDAICRDFNSKKEAIHIRNQTVERAKQHNLDIVPFKFIEDEKTNVN